MREKQINHSITFLDVFISVINNQNLIVQAYHKSSYTGLLLNFTNNQNQLKDTPHVHYFKLSYIDNLSHHIKNKLSKLCEEFCKENFSIKLVFNSFKIKIIFHIKTQFLMIWNLSWYMNLLVLAVVLDLLEKFVVILKLGLKNISKRIISLIFWSINNPL